MSGEAPVVEEGTPPPAGLCHGLEPEPENDPICVEVQVIECTVHGGGEDERFPPADWASVLSLLDGDEQAVTSSGSGNMKRMGEEERLQLTSDCLGACKRVRWDVSGLRGAIGHAADAPSEERHQSPEAGIMVLIGDALGLETSVLTGTLHTETVLLPPLRWEALVGLLALFSDHGSYDSRRRAVLRQLASAWAIDWPKVRAAEVARLEQIVNEKLLVMRGQNVGLQVAEAGDDNPRTSRSLKVGGAAVLGGAVMFATGGLATPAVAAVLGIVGAQGALAAIGGAAFVSTAFGAAGAGLGGCE
jgi:hypothetical protein